MIYGHCLVYNGEIVPFANEYEREEIERRPQVSNFASPSSRRESMQMDGQDAFLGYPHIKRGAFQTEDKPCVALLGVNSTIREKVAIILFGRNVWRLSLRVASSLLVNIENKKQLHHCTSAIRNRTSILLYTISEQIRSGSLLYPPGMRNIALTWFLNHP